MVAHLHFFPTPQAKQKNAKELPSQRTTKLQWTDKPRPKKNNEGITAPTQKAGFRASQTHLCKPKVQFSE